MYAGRNFNFFESKNKKNNKKPTKISNHNRSLSAKSDLTKNSASARIKCQQNVITLTKKQKQIREAIQYRYRKSKMREYVFEQGNCRSGRKMERSHSSQMGEYKNLKQLKQVNLKEHHEKQQKRQAQKLKQQQQFRRSVRNRLKIRTDSSLIIKTQGSQKSIDRIKFLKPYIQQSNKKTPSKNQDWKFISIQFKNNIDKHNKSQKNEVKIKSHRTMTLQQKSRQKIKTSHEGRSQRSQTSHGQMMPKFQDLNRLNQKYKF